MAPPPAILSHVIVAHILIGWLAANDYSRDGNEASEVARAGGPLAPVRGRPGLKGGAVLRRKTFQIIVCRAVSSRFAPPAASFRLIGGNVSSPGADDWRYYVLVGGFVRRWARNEECASRNCPKRPPFQSDLALRPKIGRRLALNEGFPCFDNLIITRRLFPNGDIL